VSLPDVESLRQIFGYCPRNGDLVRVSGKRAGEIVGAPNRNGYLRVWHKGRSLMVHIVIWALHRGEWPPEGFLVDHKNRKRTDNRPRNLRLASHAENSWNRAGDGVSWDAASGKWRARIQANGKRKHLGRFKTKGAALAAVKAALPEMQPKFGRAA
jgi:hypothetical protein